jgi:hypothetical protein
MQLKKLYCDEEAVSDLYCGEGFLEGTLIKTVNGYIPIEQIQVGDFLVGIYDSQEILSIKKGKVSQYVQLLIGNDYICSDVPTILSCR